VVFGSAEANFLTRIIGDTNDMAGYGACQDRIEILLNRILPGRREHTMLDTNPEDAP
jgi:hypothetical protein